jgi:hypothetical protein
MVAGSSTLGSSSRLRRLAQQSTAEREATLEHCELCSEPIPPEHRHMLDVSRRELLCACRACVTLFGSTAASAGHYRLIPDRRLRIADFELSDVAWEELRLPVDIAFLFHSTPDERVVAFYPSPMGPTESLLKLEAWRDLEAANPVLQTMEPDVEALLVNRARGARGHWLVPIDECYSLVGLIRTQWKGLTGGKQVWEDIGRFFDRLDRLARPVGKDNPRETTWRT